MSLTSVTPYKTKHHKKISPAESKAQRLRNEAAAAQRAAQYDVTSGDRAARIKEGLASRKRSKYLDDVLELRTQEKYDLLRQRPMMDDDMSPAEMEIAS
jgi:hypothetical protein